MDRLLFRLLWAILGCILLCVASGSEDDDLMDFDFADLKEIDWNYETENSQESWAKGTTEENKVTFDDDSDLLEENQLHPFDWREKVLRTALSKALMNKALRQKFVEVMPILRVLSKQQRLALSALITAQINAKQGNELKLAEVRLMFGDDKSLILPIVFDIANLVRNSAKKYIKFDYDLPDFVDFSKSSKSYERRNLKLNAAELQQEEHDEDVGTLPAAAQLGLDGLEEFMSDELLDPKEINEELEVLKVEGRNATALDDINMEGDLEEEQVDDDIASPLDINLQLQRDVPTLELLQVNKSLEVGNERPLQPAAKAPAVSRRLRRSARDSREFVHKLVRSVSFALNEDDLQRSNSARTLKLNTTAFASPKETTFRTANDPSSSSSVATTPSSSSTTTTTKAPIIITPEPEPLSEDGYESYQLVEDLAFAGLNGSDVFLDDSDNAENDLISETKSEPDDEILPTPEELISGPRYRLSGNKLSKISNGKRKRVPVRARPKKGVPGNGVLPPKKCERFTASMCIKTDDYPIDHIMGSIRRHRNAMTALLAEYNDKPSNSLDTTQDFDEYFYGQQRREDNGMQGDLCQSIVRYARPQKARSASGEWKYIVNTGQHTQTLRLEKCINPQESCSYLATSYRSHCAQVYNYHRLLSWDKTRGLHVDIFKVPTCCSCQIDGYKQQFAMEPEPIPKGFSPVYKGNFYRQQYESSEEDDEDEEFDFAIQRKHHKHDTSYDANELSSHKIRNKLSRPTVGSYLSPPVNEEYEEYIYNNPRETASIVIQHNPGSSSMQSSSGHYMRELQSRRPHQFYKESRSDQDFAPSEQHAEREVNVFGTAIGKDESTHQQRNNIYSVTQTANAGSSGASGSSTTAFTASTGTIRAFTTPSTIRQRRPTFADTNANKKPLFTTTRSFLPATGGAATSSATAATIRSTTALSAYKNGTSTVPTHYFSRTRHVLKNQSRLRIPHTITSTNTRAGGCSEINTAATSQYEHEHEVPTTSETTASSSQQSDIHAVNQNIFQNPYKTKFSLTYTTTPTISNSSSSPSPYPYPSPPKRINYSYHPIIDFFEYNKRIIAPSTTTTATPPPLMMATEITSSSSRHLPSTHSYPHKLNKPAPAFNYQQPSQKFHNYNTIRQHKNNNNYNYQQQHKTQQLKFRPQQTEQRIGYGAGAGPGPAAVAAATNGEVLSRKDSSVVASNTSHKNTNFKNSSAKNVHSTLVAPPTSSSAPAYDPLLQSSLWQPVIVQEV